MELLEEHRELMTLRHLSSPYSHCLKVAQRTLLVKKFVFLALVRRKKPTDKFISQIRFPLVAGICYGSQLPGKFLSKANIISYMLLFS